MDEPTIAIAGPDDAADLATLRSVWTDPEPEPTAHFANRLAQWMADEAVHRTFWIARTKGVAVGMVNLVAAERMPTPDHLDRGAWAYLGNMFVIESARGHGIGERLLSTVLEHAEATGVVRIMLNPSELARPLYARAGFNPAGELLLRRGPTADS